MSDSILRTAAADAGGTNLEGAFFAIHSDATSASQVSNERLAPTYAAAASDEAALSAALSFTGPGGQAATHLGVWDTATAGTFRFSVPLSGDLAFNAAGEFDVTAATVTVS